MILTFQELVDILIMTAALGYIFHDIFGKFRFVHKKDYDPLIHRPAGFDWDGFKFACMITAPAIILHELGHKIVAISYGLQATFHAAYTWLGLGIILKLMNFGFIFFVPAYVTHSGNITPLQLSAIAFAGPAVNLVLWLSAWGLLKQRNTRKKYIPFLVLTKQINMFLFIFNMVPIGFFDGAKVFKGLAMYFLG